MTQICRCLKKDFSSHLKDLRITYQCQKKTFLWVSFPILLPVRMLSAFQNWIQVTSAILNWDHLVSLQLSSMMSHDSATHFFFFIPICLILHYNAQQTKKLAGKSFEAAAGLSWNYYCFSLYKEKSFIDCRRNQISSQDFPARPPVLTCWELQCV